MGASFCVYPEPGPIIFLLAFRCGVLWPGGGGVDLPIVGTSLYLRVGFVKSGSRQSCQTSVPRHPPPANARQLLHVAYRGWVTSVQFIFVLSIKSTFALLNFGGCLNYPEPGLRARTLS